MGDNDESIFDDEPTPSKPAVQTAPPPPAPDPAAPPPEVKPQDLKAKAKILAEKIFKKGHIVDPCIGGMTFRKKLQPKDIGKTKADVPEEIIVLGHKRLIKKTALAEIEAIRGKAYSLVEQYSTESWIPSLRFMTKEAAVKVLASLKTLKEDYFKALDKFLEEYPKLKEEMLKEYPKWAEALAPFYPSPQQVKQSYHFDVAEYTVSMVTQEGEVLSQAQLEIEGDLMAKLDTFLKDTVKNTRQLFLEQLQAVKEKLDSGDKINSKTIKKIHEMIEVAQSKDIAGDTEFIALLSDLKKKFTVDASKEKSFKDEVEDTVNKIINVASDEGNAAETVSKWKRSIVV